MLAARLKSCVCQPRFERFVLNLFPIVRGRKRMITDNLDPIEDLQARGLTREEASARLAQYGPKYRSRGEVPSLPCDC
jgi:hypothetical protein